MKNSYKNIIIFLVIFAILSLALTYILVENFSNITHTSNSEFVPLSGSTGTTTTLDSNPTTIEDDSKYMSEYDDMFSTNDITIIEKHYESGKSFDVPTQEYKIYEKQAVYVQIDGLKDENIEMAINKKIKDEVVKLLDMKDSDTLARSIAVANIEIGNFSNILSLPILITDYQTIESPPDSITNYWYKYLNIDLSTGNDIEFKDLFLKNANIPKIISSSIYKSKQHSIKGEFDYPQEYYDYIYEKTGYDFTNVHPDDVYDITNEAGYMTFEDWEKTYTRPKLEEETVGETAEIMRSIANNSLHDFRIYSDSILVNKGNITFSIDVLQNLKSLTIFKRFLKDESIFTDEYPNSKQFLCGQNSHWGYKQILIKDKLLLHYHMETTRNDKVALLEEIIEQEKKRMQSIEDKVCFIYIQYDYNKEAFFVEKVELSKENYEKNKDAIFKSLNQYYYISFDSYGYQELPIKTLNDLNVAYTYSDYFVPQID